MFEMGERGLAEVADPARAFLAEHDEPAPGSVVAPTLEGSRPLLVEVQALVAPAGYGDARRERRAASIRTGWRCSSPCSAGGPASASAIHDVYVNLAGGLTVGEPALDLPLAIALASSLRDRPVPAGPSRSARSACSASCARWPGSSGGCARRPGSGSSGRSCPRPVAGHGPGRARACEIVDGRARCARRSRPGARRRTPARRGERYRRDARLTPGPAPLGPVRATAAKRRPRTSLIRNIRLLGAALGGLGRARPRRRPATACSTDASYAGFLLAAWVVAWLVVGFAILPYLTVVPAGWLIRQRPGALDRRVRDGGVGLAARPADGPAPRAAARRPSRDRSGVAAARRVAVPRARDARADGRQAGAT